MSLGDERLTTTDEKGRRLFLYPADAKGFFRKYKTISAWILITIFLAIPWIKWNGLQLLHLDISNRTFVIGGFLFKSHDAPLIFLILAIATIGLALFTSLFGRVWCGWACPQTVFIDAIYRKLETIILGNYLKKRELARQALNFAKFKKLAILWSAYFVVSALIAHSFVAYFVGSDNLLQMMKGSPEQNLNAFLIVFGMTAVLMFDFGWFREQFCIIACPYGRIQAALMDKKSMSVLYDYKRGEPRKGTAKENLGDCVNCRRCVEVCPTGIDIRRGIQMECIGCTACIDACDEIMLKVHKPTGLIRYSSEYEIENKSQLSVWKRLTRPRVILYSSAILAAVVVLIYAVGIREPLQIQVMRLKGAPYSSVVSAHGKPSIRNHITLHLHNQSLDNFEFEVIGEANSDVSMTVAKNIENLKSNQSYDLHIFFEFDKSKTQGVGKFNYNLTIKYWSDNKQNETKKELTLIGPF